MTDELDKKLKKLIEARTYRCDVDEDPHFHGDGFVEQIKQAFIDDGWVKVPKEVEETWREYNRMAGYMTGQEWYDKFTDYVYDISAEWGDKTPGSEKEWGKNHADLYIPIREVIEAAKKASGIEKEENL